MKHTYKNEKTKEVFDIRDKLGIGRNTINLYHDSDNCNCSYDLRHHRTTLSKLWSNYDDVKNGADLPNFVRRAH